MSATFNNTQITSHGHGLSVTAIFTYVQQISSFKLKKKAPSKKLFNEWTHCLEIMETQFRVYGGKKKKFPEKPAL